MRLKQHHDLEELTMPSSNDKPNTDLLKQITLLPNLSLTELKLLWRTLYNTKPPLGARSLIISKLTYRLQELAYSVDNSINQRLADCAKQYFTTNGKPPKRPRTVRPLVGSRLVRQYKGKEYCITVLEKGYEYEGCVYKSLSKIAMHITGNHWSGVAFFGLHRAKGVRG